MKRVRITYEGAYHHAMNRGINGEDIFSGDKHKAQFLDYLEEYSKKLKIRILFYCIMDNHYHIVLENSNGKMSDFFRHVNGQYGMYYRTINGDTGYVFQGRFKSTLIQNDSYLRMSIGYGLLNPVRARIVRDFDEYTWSSARNYFSNETSCIVDRQFVNELFGSKAELYNFLASILSKELPLVQTKYGEILGEEGFVETAVAKFDRRKRDFGIGMKRIDDRFFEPVEKIIWEFEKRIGMDIEDLNISTYKGKRLRGELLVRLKDLGGLRYSEINDISPFDNLRLVSLPKLYENAKKRREKDKENKERIHKFTHRPRNGENMRSKSAWEKDDAGRSKNGLSDRLPDGLSERQRKILELIDNDGAISRKTISEVIGISVTAVQKNIEILKKKDLIKRVGTTKGGRWEVIESK